MDRSGSFRLGAPLLAVKSHPNSRGSIVILNSGRIVTIQGQSTISGLIEVSCDGELVSVFEQDVLQRGVPVKRANRACSLIGDENQTGQKTA